MTMFRSRTADAAELFALEYLFRWQSGSTSPTTISAGSMKPCGSLTHEPLLRLASGVGLGQSFHRWGRTTAYF